MTATQHPAPPAAAESHAPLRHALRVVVPVVVVLLLAGAPFFLAPFALTTLTAILVFGLLASSLDLLVGVTGLPSLGHAAYFGVGAYTAGWLAINLTPTVPVGLLAGTAAGAVAAVATGWVAVRAKGIYFLMLTLAIGVLIQQVAFAWSSVTGGSTGLYGIPAPSAGGFSLGNVGFVHWYVLAGVLIGYLVLRSVVASPFGAVLRGIRDNEPRMRALGYHPYAYKLAAFTIAGAVAGLAGALFAADERLVTPSSLGFLTGALALLAVVIGGAGSLWGPFLGAALVVIIRDAFGPTLGGHGPLVLGVLFILVVYLLPRGAAGIRLRLPGRRRSGDES